jgi:hypothetical protein
MVWGTIVAQPAKPVQVEFADIPATLPPTSMALSVATEDGIVACFKTQGEWFGSATYSVRAFDSELQPRGEVNFTLNRGSYVVGLIQLGGRPYILTDEPLGAGGTSRLLMAHDLLFAEGTRGGTYFLDTARFTTIQVKPTQGRIKEDLNEEIFAFLPQGAVSSPETRFNVRVSVDNGYILVWHAAWEGGETRVLSKYYNAQWDIVGSALTIVPAGFTHYGLEPGKEAQWYGIAVNELGTMIVEQYGTETKTMELSASSTPRTDPVLRSVAVNKLLIATLSTVKDQLYGVQLHLLNFDEEDAESSFWKVEPDLAKALTTRAWEGNLKDFRLTDFQINDKAESFLTIEQQYLQSAGVRIDRHGVRRKRSADFKPADVYAGPVLLVSFATDLQPRWQYYYARQYMGKPEEGFSLLKGSWMNLQTQDADFLYATAPGSTKERAGLRSTRIDRFSGAKRKEDLLYGIQEGGIVDAYTIVRGKYVYILHRLAWRGKTVRFIRLMLP